MPEPADYQAFAPTFIVYVSLQIQRLGLETP
jgi:hypothetical protein